MRKYRVMLINPPVLKVLEPWYDAPKFVRTGLACLAAYLRQFPEFDVKIVDAKFERLKFNQVLDIVRSWKPDLVGFTAFTNEIKPAAYQAGLIKRVLPDVVTVIGGTHVTAIPERTMEEFPTLDIGAVGEGEQTLHELCSALMDGESLDNIHGLVFRDSEGRIITTPPRERILDQDSLPMPAWDMFPPAEEYFIQSIRGCPFNCFFCMNHNGRVARKRSVDSVINEMNWLISTMKPKRISFGDELFSVDMSRAHEMVDRIIAEGIGEKINWDMQTHVRYVDDLLCEKLKRSNIKVMEVGVETGDEETLKRMGKGTTREMILAAFDSARRFGVPTAALIILGQPNETFGSMFRTIRFGIKLNPAYPIYSTMVPFPGTEVARIAAKGEGGYQLISTNWDDYGKQLNNCLAFTNISRTWLDWFQVFGYVGTFFFNFRFGDLLRFFWSYRGGAINLFLKALIKKRTSDKMMDLPDDYETVLSSPKNTTVEDMINSRKHWLDYQNREIKRVRHLKPELLKTGTAAS